MAFGEKLAEHDRLDVLLQFIRKQMSRAKVVHPNFAESAQGGFLALSEEFGEVAKEISKQNEKWEERMDEELIDLIVVALRILNRDYENGYTTKV